jgi:hypothetical protein
MFPVFKSVSTIEDPEGSLESAQRGKTVKLSTVLKNVRTVCNAAGS